jgi:threonine aldolase
MRSARLGLAAFGEDESVNELERRGAELLGKEAAAFVATCSLGNLAAVLALTRPGGRAALSERAHILVNEGDWLTEIARLEPVGFDEAASAAVICLENTHTRKGGIVMDPDETAARRAAAESASRRARLANAAVALGVSLADLAAPVDTASEPEQGPLRPFRAILAGDAETIAAAHHLKRLGGGTVHKAGSAGGASSPSSGCSTASPRITSARAPAGRADRRRPPETNIVYTDLSPVQSSSRSRGVVTMELEGRVRFVTHPADRRRRDPPRGRGGDQQCCAETSAVRTATRPAT